jgi:hypothetical protein
MCEVLTNIGKTPTNIGNTLANTDKILNNAF